MLILKPTKRKRIISCCAVDDFPLMCHGTGFGNHCFRYIASQSICLTFSVLQDPLNQHRVLGYSLGHQQNAFWDAETSNNAAAHLFLIEEKKTTTLNRTVKNWLE